MATEITNTEDIIDFRDVTDRVEELAGLDEPDEDEAAELAMLQALLDETRGNGGDHQWRGDWYPGSMIRDSYFEEYAQELADDIGAIDKDLGWPTAYIDWKAAAEALQQDYGSVTLGGVDYWYR